VALLVLGAVDTGGAGCACPENVLLRALVTDLVLRRDETLVMDMEAGIEHLGRATARGVDVMLVVVEPGQGSIDCALRVRRMARDIGIKFVCAVANKIASAGDDEFVRQAAGDLDLIGSIPLSETIRRADRKGISVLDEADVNLTTCFVQILKRLDSLDSRALPGPFGERKQAMNRR
jgi:CO dehydrogenase maturation factor